MQGGVRRLDQHAGERVAAGELRLRRHAVVPAARERVVAARAVGRVVRHRHCALGRDGIGNLRDHDAVGTEVEHALHEERIGTRRAHDRAGAAVLAGEDRAFERREVPAAVLAVEEDEVQPGDGERAGHLRLRYAAPDAGKRPALRKLAAEGVAGGVHDGPSYSPPGRSREARLPRYHPAADGGLLAVNT